MKKRLKISTGRISDVLGGAVRSDWSDLSESIKSLQPGQTRIVICPKNIPISRLRSTILTSAKRVRNDTDWRVSTKTESGKVLIFLVPSIQQ